ncbi:MAG: putative Ig domain-containing protein [Bacteroidales bacterium]|nr:putative Ig domain-containing protein [Bacteroidales bacterium]
MKTIFINMITMILACLPIVSWADVPNYSSGANPNDVITSGTPSISGIGNIAYWYSSKSGEGLTNTFTSNTNVSSNQNFTIFIVGHVSGKNKYFINQSKDSRYFILGYGDNKCGFKYNEKNNSLSNTFGDNKYTTDHIFTFTCSKKSQNFWRDMDNNINSAYDLRDFGNITLNKDASYKEVIIFKGVLTTEQLEIVNQYLAEKNGISLGTTNDKFTCPAGYNLNSFAAVASSYTTQNSDVLTISNTNIGSDYIFAVSDLATPYSEKVGKSDKYVIYSCGRNWYIQTTSENNKTTLTFDFNKLFGNNPDFDNEDYVLLYKENLTDVYQKITNLPSDNLSYSNFTLKSGYYTLGIAIDESLKPSDNPDFGSEQVTWYSFKTGDWTDPDTWTLDPAGISWINPEGKYPQEEDNAFIISGNTVYMENQYNNVDFNISGTILTVNGCLQLNKNTNHEYDYIKGNGRIEMKTDNFPKGDASAFINPDLGGGTAVYVGDNTELNIDRNYCHLEINSPSNIYLNSNIVCHGNVLVKNGNLNFGANSSSCNNAKLVVYGKLLVEASASISSNSCVNELDLYGDFENYGVVNFSTLSDYSENSLTSGYTKVRFLNKNKRQVASFRNTANFYSLEMNKGADYTYELKLTANSKDYFNIYGPAQSTTNSLILEAGTLEVGANVKIPYLNKNTDYLIKSSVQVLVDAGFLDNNGSSIVVEGKLKVSDGGSLTANKDIKLKNNGALEIAGGTTTTTGIYNLSNTDIGSYYQTGGSVSISGGTAAYPFALSNNTSAFYMTGGNLYINRGGIFLNSDQSYYSVTGGNVYFDIQDGNNFKVTSKVPFPNLTIQNASNKSAKVLASDGTFNSQTVVAQPLQVIGNLTINSSATLDYTSNDVYIAGNLINNGTYTCSSNKTIFSGDKVSNITVSNNFTFNKLEINKKNITTAVNAKSSFTINDNFEIINGKFYTDGVVINAKKDISITEGEIANSSNTSKIVLNGTVNQTLTGPSHNPANFGNIYYANTNNLQLGSNIKVNDFTFASSSKCVDLNSYYIYIQNNLINENANFSANYFNNNGKSSGGLKMNLNVTANSNILFPIGTSSTYIPATISVNNNVTGTYSGSVLINSVPTKHPCMSGTGIDRYWIVSQEGFDNATALKGNVSYIFENNANIAANSISYGIIGLNGCVTSSESPASKQFKFINSNFGLVSGEFTVGANGTFNDLKIWRTRVVGGNDDIDYNSKTAWETLNTATGDWANSSSYPKNATDIVYIRANRINVSNSITWGELYFDNPITGELTSIDELPRLQVKSGASATIGKIVGEGVVHVWAKDNLGGNPVTADMSQFCKEPNSSIIICFTRLDLTNPPTFDEYPNLSIEDNGRNGNKFSFPNDTRINYNLNLRGKVKFIVNNNIYVGKDIQVGDWMSAQVEFQGNTPHTLTIGRDVDFTRDSKNGYANECNNRIISVSGDSQIEHRLIVGGNFKCIGSDGCGSLKLSQGTGKANVILELNGGGDCVADYTAKDNFNLWKLVMNKDKGATFTFGKEFNIVATSDQIQMKSGHLIISNGQTFDLNNVDNAPNFIIEPDAELETKNGTIVNVKKSNVVLSGKITIDGGSVWNVDKCLEYTASENCAIEIKDGTLNVGQQLRRSLAAEGSVNLNLSNQNSKLNIGDKITSTFSSNGRGLFELTNFSKLTMVKDATITVKNPSGFYDIADIYINPRESNINKESNFVIDNQNSSKPVTLYSSVDLGNLTISKGSAQMQTGNLTIGGLFSINSTTTFNTSSLDLIIKGNMNVAGKFNHDNNTTYFSGTENQIVNGKIDFYNLIKNTSNNLLFNNPIKILNNADFLNGTFKDGGSYIAVKGNITNDAVYEWSGEGEGLALIGDIRQLVSSNGGVFGKLNLMNSLGAFMNLGSNFTITKSFCLTKGVFAIDKNYITLGANAIFESPAGVSFSNNNMVSVTDAYADGGVRKIIANGYTGNIIVPIGTTKKYTPVEYSITNFGVESGTEGYFEVRPVNEIANFIQEDVEECGSNIVDRENVLKYHWVLKANNVKSFSGNILFTHVTGDAQISSSNSLADYITARQVLNTTYIRKFANNDYDENNCKLTFSCNYSSSAGAEISGYYLAGLQKDCGSAIPDAIQRFKSCDSGNWTNPNVWSLYDESNNTWGEPGVGVPANGPIGSIVEIESDHTIDIPNNGVKNFRTIINGVLDQNSTIKNCLGDLSGTGTIASEHGDLPAGNYSEFNCKDGGTLKYYGTNNYSVLKEMPIVNNIIFEGSGERVLPNSDIQIYGDFTIDGDNISTAQLKVLNSNNKNISLAGSLIMDNGMFETGHEGSMFTFNGTKQQVVKGTPFTIENGCYIYYMVVNNPKGVKLETDVDVLNKLQFIDGVIYTSESSLLTLDAIDNKNVFGYGPSKYVDGPFAKRINGGESFDFPVGNNGRYGIINVSATTGGNSHIWTAEYFAKTPDYYSAENLLDPLQAVSTNEYWSVYSDNSSLQSYVTIRWDENSGVVDPDNVCQAFLNNDNKWEMSGSIATQNGNTGNIISDNLIAIGNTSKYFTFGYYKIHETNWLGSVSSDWFDKANWKDGLLPAINVAVTIGGKPTYWPILSDNEKVAYANSLKLVDEALLTINAGNGLTVAKDVDVDEKAIISLKASTNYVPTGSLVYYGNYDGNIQFGHYFPAKKFERACIPLQSYMFYDFAKDQSCNNLYQYVESKDLNNNPLTAPAIVDEHLQLAGAWDKINVGVKKEFSYKDAFNFAVSPKSVMSEAIGKPVSGDVEYTGLTYTNNDPVDGPNKDVFDGWNYVSNPFVSAVDASKIEFVNTDNSVYFYDKSTDMYYSYNVATKTYSGVDCRYIPAGQSFFVHTTEAAGNGNGVIKFPNSSRSHGDANTRLKGKFEGDNGIEKIELVSTNNKFSYQTVVAFVDGATDKFDSKYDSYYLESDNNNVMNIYSIVDNLGVSINSLPLSQKGEKEVQLAYSTGKSGTFSITLKSNSLKNTKVFIIDTEKNITKEMTLGDSYTFEANAGVNTSRLKLKFEVNNPPVLTKPIENVSTLKFQEFEYCLGENIFVDNDKNDYVANIDVTMANGTKLPKWLDFDYETNTLYGIPKNGDVGIYNLAITAKDRQNLATTVYFNVEVIDVNSAPTAKPIENIELTEGDDFWLNISKYFEDIDEDKLVYSISSNNNWLFINANSGVLSGVPQRNNIGENNIIVRATDPKGLFAEINFIINVDKLNSAPKGKIDDIYTTIGNFSYSLIENAFVDEDGDALTYEYTLGDGNPLPSYITFNSSNGAFACNTDFSQTIKMKLIVTDSKGASVQCYFTITIDIQDDVEDSDEENQNDDEDNNEESVDDNTSDDNSNVDDNNSTNSNVDNENQHSSHHNSDNNTNQKGNYNDLDNNDEFQKDVKREDVVINRTKDVKLYPVPTNGIVNIELGDLLIENSSVNLKVINGLGQVIISTNLVNQKSQIDLTGYRKGIYFVRLTTNDRIVVKKIVLE